MRIPGTPFSDDYDPSDFHGVKKKKIKESSLVEAVDLIICSLSLFFANGGKIDDLCNIGQEKLNKWEERV